MDQSSAVEGRIRSGLIGDDNGEDWATTDLRQTQEGWTGKWSLQAVPGLGHNGGVFKRDVEMGA